MNPLFIALIVGGIFYVLQQKNTDVADAASAVENAGDGNANTNLLSAFNQTLQQAIAKISGAGSGSKGSGSGSGSGSNGGVNLPSSPGGNKNGSDPLTQDSGTYADPSSSDPLTQDGGTTADGSSSGDPLTSDGGTYADTSTDDGSIDDGSFDDADYGDL